jgi:hypothetical protein
VEGSGERPPWMASVDDAWTDSWTMTNSEKNARKDGNEKTTAPGPVVHRARVVGGAVVQRGSVVRYRFERSLVDTPPPGPGMGMRIASGWRSKWLDMIVARARVRRAVSESTQVCAGVKRVSVRTCLFDVLVIARHRRRTVST